MAVTLSSASHLSRPELLKRRFHNLNHLSKCYRDLYWVLMEDLKILYRHYLWDYGLTPFKESQTNNIPTDSDVVRCAFVGCKLKAMPLTTFCHLHILSDSKQKLYKPCNYVIKSAQAGPITCGKPIMGSTVPSLCIVHFQKAQKHLTRTLKRTGLNISSTSKMAPKFHVIVMEYIHHIQVKRRKEVKGNKSKIVAQNQTDS
ncbi:putative DNA-binding domain [Sesbania bispinosa]|nr:putative DNA-binding domain [Sesbania bispinosa]